MSLNFVYSFSVKALIIAEMWALMDLWWFM